MNNQLSPAQREWLGEPFMLIAVVPPEDEIEMWEGLLDWTHSRPVAIITERNLIIYDKWGEA